MKTPEEINKMSLLEFVLFLNSLTTTEICKQFNIPLPVFTGDVKSSANQFLQIDVILWRMVKEQAKSLFLLEQSNPNINAEEILDKCLNDVNCSNGIKSLKFTLSDNAYKGIINAINTSQIKKTPIAMEKDELIKYERWKIDTTIDISRLSNERTIEEYLLYKETIFRQTK